jgi:hypothetical protein
LRKGGHLLVLAVYVAAILIAVRNFDMGFNLGDEGVAAMGAWRIAQGQIPHRDFFEIIPPGSFLPTALAIGTLGPSVFALRLTALLLQFALLISADLSLKALSPNPVPRALLLLFLGGFGVPLWNMPSHHWFVDAAQLGAIACLAAGLRGRAWLWGILGGGLSAYGVYCLQDQGGIFVLALGVGFFPWVEGKKARRILLQAWLIGLALVTLPFLLWLLPSAGPVELFHQWVVHPLTRYKRLEGHNPGLLGGFEEQIQLVTSGAWRRAPLFFGAYFTSALCIFLLPLSAFSACVAAARRRWVPRAVVGLYASGCLAAVATAARRWGLRNLDWAAPVLAVVVFWVLGRFLSDHRMGIRLVARGCAATLAAAFGIYAASMYWVGGRTDLPRLSSRAGSLRGVNPDQILPAQGLVDAVERLVPQGAPIFCKGYIPMVNFLVQRPNPARFNILLEPQYNTPLQVAEAMANLEEKHVGFVVTKPGLDAASNMDRYLRENFRPIWRNDSFVLAARKSLQVKSDTPAHSP